MFPKPSPTLNVFAVLDGIGASEHVWIMAICEQSYQFRRCVELTANDLASDLNRPWNHPGMFSLLSAGHWLADELRDCEIELLEFCASTAKAFLALTHLPGTDRTAEGSIYIIGPEFPDFKPANLSFNIDSCDRDLAVVYDLTQEGTALLANALRTYREIVESAFS